MKKLGVKTSVHHTLQEDHIRGVSFCALVKLSGHDISEFFPSDRSQQLNVSDSISTGILVILLAYVFLKHCYL